MDYNQLSLEMHEKNKGKLEVVSKVPIETRDDLSTAYTPGVAEPCRDDTGGDGDHPDSEEGDYYPEEFSHGSHGIDIAVAHGEQGRGRPPDTGKRVGKNLGLGAVFHGIHAKGRRHHQYHYNEN